MDTRKVYLEENKDVNSVNEQSFVGINLTTKSKLLPYNNISDVLNLNNLYIAERNACTKYRLILTVNPICSNVLFNYRTEVVRYEGSSACTSLIYDSEIPPEPTPSGETPSLSVNPTSLEYESTGGTQQITVHAEYQGWRINTKPDWIQLSTMTGTEGDTIVNITASPNNLKKEREDKITIVGTKKGRVVLTITQKCGLHYELVVKRVDGKYEQAIPPRYLRAYLTKYTCEGEVIEERDVTTQCTWEWYNSSKAGTCATLTDGRTTGSIDSYEGQPAFLVVYQPEVLDCLNEPDERKKARCRAAYKITACPLDSYKAIYTADDGITYVATFIIQVYIN